MILYDIIIIGGGPIGLNCALEAQKSGLSYLVIEKGTIVNSLYNYPLYMTFFSSADNHHACCQWIEGAGMTYLQLFYLVFLA